MDPSLRPSHILDECRQAFFDFDPSRKDDMTPPEKLQPWVDMLRELLLESQLPELLMDRLLRAMSPRSTTTPLSPSSAPTVHVHTAPAGSAPRTFHRFRDLPAELRITIWKPASAQPRRVLRWGDRDESRRISIPFNATTTHMPLIAQACNEARGVVNTRGKLLRAAGSKLLPAVGTSLPPAFGEDLGFVARSGLHPEGSKHPRLVLGAWASDFLFSRKEIAVDYKDFSFSGGCRRPYRFLYSSDRLETLVCITATPNISIDGRAESEAENESVGNRRAHYRRPRSQTRILQKLVMHEEADEFERVNALWKSVEPESHWVWRDKQDLQILDAGIYAPRTASRCLDCERRRWKDKCTRNDRAIFPGRDEFNQEHPWAAKALARMPKLKPAVLLTIHDAAVGDSYY
ncbi:hypothetical protein C8A00DRAFT_36770 [Chaetomidium leptoderma]|uniref:2EXR domain-containing protein n=1 Tax=Chaetomidium leptoderma TaxID=669021 RepID=A0AAN6ZSV2_9PEZI|nr:hypothetical protein C8A00DRAFT_36770 [Chaetomidium leptoderma]